MSRTFIPFLLLLISGTASANQSPIEVIEYLDDVNVVAFINASDMTGLSQWQPLESPPPLSINDAMQAVQNYLKTDGVFSDLKFKGIELKQIARHEDLWHYLVKMEYKQNEATQPHFFVVLMNGKVIAALKEPDAIK